MQVNSKELFVNAHFSRKINPFLAAYKKDSIYPANRFQIQLEKLFPDLSMSENEELDRYYFTKLVHAVSVRVFQILDADLNCFNRYLKEFHSISISVFSKILRGDLPETELTDQQISGHFCDHIDPGQLKLLHLKAAMIETISSYVRNFLKPYKEGLITAETEDKNRSPLIIGLYPFLANRYKSPVPFEMAQVEKCALDAYLFEGGRYIIDQFNAETGKIPLIQEISNLLRYRGIFTGCCSAIDKAVKIDFKGLEIPQTEIEKRVFQNLLNYTIP